VNAGHEQRTHFRSSAVLDPRWAGHPHDGVFEGLPAALLVVQQSREHQSEAAAFQSDKCISCGECLKVCQPHALAKEASGRIKVDRARCTNCGDCAPVCDPKALEMVGHDTEVDAVMEVVLRDRDYYAQSGGGMTISGGEPLLQPEFVENLIHAAKNYGLHCCVETSGYAGGEIFERLRLVVDLWLFDYKETDPNRHARYTGRERQTIVQRLQELHDSGAPILLRCPMIPGLNTRADHLDGIVALARRLPHLQGVELLPYFDFWRGKLERFGLKSDMPLTTKPPPHDVFDSWKAYLRERGVRVVG
jgi:glycyl-radical enzyme activating protein